MTKLNSWSYVKFILNTYIDKKLTSTTCSSVLEMKRNKAKWAIKKLDRRKSSARVHT